MPQNYLISAFHAFTARRFPAQAAALNAALAKRLDELHTENADAPKALQFHYEQQIFPGIAAYETLQTVLPKDEALSTIHGWVEASARQYHRTMLALLHLPGLYRLVPGLAAKITAKVYGGAAGFAATTLQADKAVWRLDMTKCPYHDTCVRYNCPELCPCFCDSDDVTYSGLHPHLVWQRIKTLGRGDDRCDFCLRLQ